MNRLHPSTSPLGIFLVVAVIYIATIALIERRGLWIIDNQIKFLQVEQIVESHARDYSLPWAGAALDRGLRYPPMVFPFYAVDEGKLYPAYSPFFPLCSAGPYALFGMAGLYLLPLLGGLATLLGVVWLARSAGLPPRGQAAAMLLCGLLTPVWFYSTVFWEHTVAVAACILGLGFVGRFLREGSWKSLGAGSALCALGIYFRDDLYVFCAALALITMLSTPATDSGEGRIVWMRRIRVALLMGCAMLATLVPLWLFQGWAVGHPFGFHIGVHVLDFPGLGAHLASRAEVFYALFVQSSPSTWLSIALAAPFLIGLAIRPRSSERIFLIAVPVAALVALAAFAVIMAGYFGAGSPMMAMFRANGLFAASPILICAFLRRKGDPDSFLSGFLWKLALVYILIYSLVSPLDATRGVHWGNRLVLVLYPMFALMAAEQLHRWSEASRAALARTAVGLTAIVSLAAQVYAITLLDQKQEVTRRINETIAARPEPAILTDVWWAPLELYTLFPERPIFLVDSREKMNELLATLSGTGHDACLLVTEPNRTVSLTPVAVIEDDALGFRSLKLYRIEL